METFDDYSRGSCVVRIRVERKDVVYWADERRLIADDAAAVVEMTRELEARNNIIGLRKRLLEIEVQERDALSIELQKATLDAEEARAKDAT